MFANDYIVEPLVFSADDVDDFEFDVITAQSFVASPTVKVYVDKSLDLAKVVFPIEHTLARVGIFRIGVASLPFKFVPHNRAFEVLSTGAFQYRGEPILRVELPMFGAETMTNSMLSSIAFSTFVGTMVCGQSTVTAVVRGVRREIVGPEIVQFTIQTQHYRATFVYDEDSIYSIKATKPALYVRDGMDLWCVYGQPAPEMHAREVQWYEPSFETLNMFNDAAALIFNVNCIDYRVSRERIVTLQALDCGHCVDGNGRTFVCARLNGEEEVGLVKDDHYKCVLVSDSTVLVRCMSTDRVDSAGIVDRMLKSPLITGLVDRVPVVSRVPMTVELQYLVPQFRPFNAYRAYVFSHGGIGPMTWASANSRPLMTADAVVDSLVHSGVDQVTPQSVAEYANENGVYLVGQSVRSLTARIPARSLRVGRLNLTTVPGSASVGCLVIRRGARSLLDQTFASAVRYLGGVDPYYVLYFTPVLEGLPLELSDVVSDSVAPSYPSVQSIIKILDAVPLPAVAIAKQLGFPKQAVNMVLYGRVDLFECVRGDPIIWKLKK